jgi:hypothetical protein
LEAGTEKLKAEFLPTSGTGQIAPESGPRTCRRKEKRAASRQPFAYDTRLKRSDRQRTNF